MAGKDHGKKPGKERDRGRGQSRPPSDGLVSLEEKDPEMKGEHGKPSESGPSPPSPGQSGSVVVRVDDAPAAPMPPRRPRPHRGFDAERAAYARLKPALLEKDLGRFVVFVGDEMVGPCDDFRAAYVAGRRRFGPGPLYIKQVLAEEPVFEPVGLEPCPS
jgi:hypothetical protein